MAEMHLRQPGFSYSASRTFTKNPKTKKELKNQSNGRFKIYLSKRIR